MIVPGQVLGMGQKSFWIMRKFVGKGKVYCSVSNVRKWGRRVQASGFGEKEYLRVDKRKEVKRR
jgi:hypothetical protein